MKKRIGTRKHSPGPRRGLCRVAEWRDTVEAKASEAGHAPPNPLLQQVIGMEPRVDLPMTVGTDENALIQLWT